MALMPKRRPLFQVNPSTRPGKDYNVGGISHQEPCGKAVFGPLNRPSLMSLARKDGNTVLRFHTRCGSQGALLHAILVDGIIEKSKEPPSLRTPLFGSSGKQGTVLNTSSPPELNKSSNGREHLIRCCNVSALRPTERSYREQHSGWEPQS